jgi:hypothetical protein
MIVIFKKQAVSSKLLIKAGMLSFQTKRKNIQNGGKK